MKDDAKPDGMIRRAIKRIKLSEDDTPIAPIQGPAPDPVEATPSSTMLDAMCGVYCGKSNRELLNQEFAGGPFQDDPVTENWRHSLIESSKPRVPQNEIDPTDGAAVEAALQNQQAANIIPFRVSK
jgi:hypothetical protein